jgi:imidazolonepropionase-like amidohydrolase/Tol biopolymer transport system component
MRLVPLACALLASQSLADPDAGEPPWSVDEPGLPGRDVPLDVREGTWMSVDVNARGEVAFDLLGDLYLVPLDGGEARELTHGAAWDMQPRFSPDGSRLAFTSDRGGGDNLWVLPLDGGAPTPVTREKVRLVNSPAWSPDGRFLVGRKHFTSRRSLGSGELWLYHLTGGEGVQLTEKPNEQKDVGEPAFSPDGRYVYFSQDVTPGATFEYNKDPNGEIYAIQRLDLETREVTRFVDGPGGSVRPTPSPDGTRLAFVRRVRGKSVLMVADVASGAERTLYEAMDRDLQETWAIHGVAPAFAWTRDGAQLVFSAKGGLWRLEVASGRVTRIPFHVKTSRRLFDALHFQHPAAPDELAVKAVRWAQVAPAGGAVVFEALGRLWLKALPGGAPRRLTPQDAEAEAYPSFTRDGSSIVYVTWSDTALGAVRLAPATGGPGRALTAQPGHYAEPVLSPDGRFLVYRALGGSLVRSGRFTRQAGLYVQPAAGGEPRRLAKDGEHPHFGERSDRVYFLTVDESGKDDVRSLKSIRLDGSDERTHLTSADATEYAVSPDGKWVAWRQNFKAYAMPFPRGARAAVAAADSHALPVLALQGDAGRWLHWSQDSRWLHWSHGPTLCTQPVADPSVWPEPGPQAAPSEEPLGFTTRPALARGVVAFVGGRVISMKGAEVLEDATVLVKDGRIAAVGPRAQVAVPAGARVIDVAEKTLMPGLVDVHWHGDVGDDGLIPQQSWVLAASLAFGVTTVHDPSSDTETFFAAAEQARLGALLAPRMFSTGTVLYGAQGWLHATVETLDDARAHLRRLRELGAFSVKSYNQPRRDQRQKLLRAARELQMLVVPEGGSLLAQNLSMVVDGHTGVEHALPVEAVYEDVQQLWSQSGTGWTPTLGVAYGGLWGENTWYQTSDVWADERLSRFVPRRHLDARSRRRLLTPPEEWNHVAVARTAKALGDRGVSIQLGAHGQREGLAAHWELWSFVQGGMSPHQALRAGTWAGAWYLGLEQDLGSLEVGKLADLLVLDANPLDDIRNSRQVHFTVLGGRVLDAATLDEVWPQPRRRAPFFFEREGGEAWPVGLGVGAGAEAE